MKISTSPSVVFRISLWILMLFGGAAFSLKQDYESELFKNINFHILTLAASFVVLTLSFRAAANGGRELKKGRVGNIPRLETNRLVTTGIYSCMRHPMLFGLTLLPLGFALFLGSPTFIFKIAPFEMLFIVFMILVFEEMEVSKKYKTKYHEYKKTTPAINISFKCLKELFKK